ESPTYGAISKRLKWFSKTDDLIKWATIVTCGNRSIAEYVSSKGACAHLIPTVVDSDVFTPVQRANSDSPLVLGWIGTHSTFPYLESIFPVLSSLAKRFDFRLMIVCAGRNDVAFPGVPVECLLINEGRRHEMGAAGRAHVVAHYGLQEQADKLAAALREALTVRGN